VTSATVPSFNETSIESHDECWVEILWYKAPSSSVVLFYGKPKSAEEDFGRDILFVDIQLFLEPFTYIIKSERSLKYRCTSSNLCNNASTLKNLLNSSILEERFNEEFHTLIQGNKFDNNTAATCFRSTNIPSTCEMPSLDSCQRCTTDVYQSSGANEKICASCEMLIEGNRITSESQFLFDNRTHFNHIHVGCQQEGCNSMETINKIRQFSTITFDFDKFFGTSPNSATSLNVSILFLIFFITFQFYFKVTVI